MPAATVLTRSIPVPGEVLRHLAITHPQRYPVLFDSVAAGPLGRASILVARPSAALVLTASGEVHGEGMRPQPGGFLQALEAWWRAERIPAGSPAGSAAQRLPFTGGWALFLGYELAAEVEPRLVLPPSDLPFTAFALRTPCALVHAGGSDQVLAVAEVQHADALDELAEEAERAARDLARPLAPLPAFSVREEDPSRFIERVLRAKEYIRAGDIYQANLSRRWDVHLGEGSSTAASLAGPLYARLCGTNPAPFAALAQWQDVALLSSPPERLIRIEDRQVETRPIAGTRPRSLRPGDDAAEAAALIAHPKERAEHVMLIDLERNDLGRVCEAGSVRVDELMVTETYAHVHHIVSNVRGRLRPEVTPIGALRAVFPGGTITGCPKVRCMQIIAELEREGRGAYTGALGYLTREGVLDSNILIRTMTLRGRELSLRAGAGIVADSDPQRELEETRAKARGLLAALAPPAQGRAG